jgi:hypothetical protein
MACACLGNGQVAKKISPRESFSKTLPSYLTKASYIRWPIKAAI